MTKPSESEYSISEVAGWLFTAIEGHLPVKEIESTLVSRFGCPEDEACIALQCARDGMLRQYFPKGMDLSNVHQNRLNAVARRLNERPRETLQFYSPAEKFSECVAATGRNRNRKRSIKPCELLAQTSGPD